MLPQGGARFGFWDLARSELSGSSITAAQAVNLTSLLGIHSETQTSMLRFLLIFPLVNSELVIAGFQHPPIMRRAPQTAKDGPGMGVALTSVRPPCELPCPLLLLQEPSLARFVSSDDKLTAERGRAIL